MYIEQAVKLIDIVILEHCAISLIVNCGFMTSKIIFCLDSAHNPRNIQFSFAGAIIESYKVSPVIRRHSFLAITAS